MSKIGKQPVKIIEGVTVQLDKNKLTVKGPKGFLEQIIRPEIDVKIEEGEVVLTARDQSNFTKALHGLFRSLIKNMVKGVTEGFEKVLELHGTGYRAILEGTSLKFTLGFSHPVIVSAPQGIEFKVEGSNLIKIKGIDNQLVGQTAAKIRHIKPPEPYKGKGIRYRHEIIKKKAGKTAKVGSAES